MYDALILSSSSKSELLKMFEPKYPDILADHVTIKFGIGHNYTQPKIQSAWIIGYFDDGDGCEALLVSVDGESIRKDGIPYHITWSIDRLKGVKPVHSGIKAAEMKDKWIVLPSKFELKFEHKIIR